MKLYWDAEQKGLMAEIDIENRTITACIRNVGIDKEGNYWTEEALKKIADDLNKNGTTIKGQDLRRWK